MSLKDFTQAGNFQAPKWVTPDSSMGGHCSTSRRSNVWLESVGVDREMSVNVGAGLADKPC